ncbi:DUF47 family protein [Desulfovibrio subterraneus]|jgi:hypothetical protein|uniref:Phosphate transport regulator n=1 Tax=Desulfovibrio subterraneus TaxID=2718620 RepID=A0A7J0BN71_9BACT|nr:DUF47 family protein [Desulfovibrio subterraneus]WBF66592.1 DUF47 family protein [Desulfovibrio subterraneus]GFM34711.1 hypothetical protein DSM101010T_30760 [Desulfovibrio subterraneus]
MTFKVPFFGLLSERSPMGGLLEHYAQIGKGMGLIRESLECYITGGQCREFNSLQEEVNEVEDKADKIKRNIRNHLPRGLFMAVDKTLFLNYTRSQDNILDAGQDALNWLAMRRVEVPEMFHKQFLDYMDAVDKTLELLGPALEATIGLVQGVGKLDREGVKNTFRAIRYHHKDVFRYKQQLISAIYNSDMEFKDIYQLLHFVECLNEMSHNAENCADMLRAMIAR